MGSIVSSVGNIIGLDQGNRQQQTGYSNANGIINQQYGKGAEALQGGYGQGIQNLNTGYGNAANSLTQGLQLGTDPINQYYGQAANNYQPYTNAGGAAANQLSNLINSGYGSHQFNTQDLYNGLSPNYDFQLKQGQGNAAAMANAGGGLLGGNALQGLNEFTQNFAGNAYQQAFKNYQDQRNSIFGNNQNAANMGLNATNNLANVLTGQGNRLSDLGSAYGSANAGLNVNQGANLAGLNVGQGQNLANLYTGQGRILAGNNIDAGKLAAENTMAQYNQGGKAFASGAGDAKDLGGALSNIGKLFSLG